MTSVAKVVFAGMLFAAAVFAQSPAPDCQYTRSISAATAAPAFANKPTSTGGIPCVYWVVQYWTNGASGVSIKLEGAADAAGAPTGSYTALTASSGSNPMTGTTQGSAILCCDYYPWLRVNPTTFSGTSQTMIVRAYGWRAPTNPTTGSGAAANVNIADFGGAAVSIGQQLMAASMPVVISSNQSAIAVTPAANSSVNVAQVAGTTAAVNAGNANAGTQRVILAADQSAIPVTPAANSAVNVAQVAGTTAAVNAGNANAGTQRVIVASDQSALPVTPAANSSVNVNQISGVTIDPCYGQVKVIALVNLTANTRIITGTSAKKTYICSVNLVAAAATNVAIVEGTGSTCGTSTLGLFGGATAASGWNFAANGGIAYGAGVGTLASSTVNQNDVCVFVSAANQITGSVAYVVL